MEVGQEGVDPADRHPRPQVDPRLADEGPEAAVLADAGFQDPRRRGPDRDDPSPGTACGVQTVGDLRGDGGPLGVQLVPLDRLGS